MFIELVKSAKDNSFIKEIIRQMDVIGRKYFSGGGTGYVSYGEPGVPEAEQTGTITLTPEELDTIRKTFGLHKDKDMDPEELPDMLGHSGLLDLSELEKGKIVILDPTPIIYSLPDVKLIRRKLGRKRIPVPGTNVFAKSLNDKNLVEAIHAISNLREKMGSRNNYMVESLGRGHYIVVKFGEEVYSKPYSEGLDGDAFITAKGAKAVYETGKYLIIDIAPGDHSEGEFAPVYLRVRAPVISSTNRARANNRARTNKNRNQKRGAHCQERTVN